MTEQGNNNQTSRIGPLLRAYRLKQGTSLQEAAASLQIRESFLRSIEDGNYGALPGTTYATGFIRAYAEYLDLDGAEAVRRFRAEAEVPKTTPALQFPTPMYESSTPRTGVVLVGLLLSVVAYGAWYTSTIKDGFIVELVAPVPGRLASLLPGDDISSGSVPSSRGEGVGGSQPGTAEPKMVADSAVATPDQHATAVASTDKLDENESKAVTAQPTASPGISGSQARTLDGPAELDVASATSSSSEAGSAVDAEANDVAALERPVVVETVHGRSVGSDAFAAEPSTTFDGESLGARFANGDTELAALGDTSRNASSSRIVLKAVAKTWVQVKDGQGNRVISRLMKAGEAYNVPDEIGLKMKVGNAGGLQVVVDGQAVPVLGKAGEVVRVVLDVDRLRDGTAID